MIPRILAGMVVTAALYFLFLGGEYTFLDLWHLEQQQAVEVRELEAVRAEAARLEEKVDSLATDSAALERLARERFGLIREGERLYRFAEPDSARTAEDPGGAPDR